MKLAIYYFKACSNFGEKKSLNIRDFYDMEDVSSTNCNLGLGHLFGMEVRNIPIQTQTNLPPSKTGHVW